MFLNWRTLREFRHILGSPFPQVVHPILYKTFYLSTEHKRRLKEEYGHLFLLCSLSLHFLLVPAGCPHQVRNLKSCINVAIDFISPENVNECIRLTKELRKLPRNHDSGEDKLGVKKIIIRTMSQVANQLEKTLLNSEAGIGTGLAISSSISKRPSMPKSSSVSDDPSSSMTVNREEYVSPNEDEKPRTTKVYLQSPLPVFSANKAQESTLVPSQELKQLINIEDVESTFHTVQSFLKSLPEQYPSQQSGLQSSISSSAQTLAKLIFECSISLPLEALAHDPMNEKEMHVAIAALNENPSSLFSNNKPSNWLNSSMNCLSWIRNGGTWRNTNQVTRNS